MASKLSILLLLGALSCVIAAPTSTEQPDDANTAVADEVIPIFEVIEVVDEIPVQIVETTTSDDEAKETVHKVSKRSALRGDNPSNDLLANFDGLLYENGVSSLDGRRIKFLPTWLG